MRYFRLLLAFARYGLAREMAFRGNFLVKLLVEIIWLGMMLVFYSTVFSKTSVVASWNQEQFLFFIGCYFALEGLIETLFLENCDQFAQLVRTGDLDFYLLKPIDEQFLLTLRHIDWSTASNVLMGCGVMIIALIQMDWEFDPFRILLFVAMFICGTAIGYSFLLTLSSLSIWWVRNQSLMELWWLFTSLTRYPREIFSQSWAAPIGILFSFILPVMLVVHVPASVMVKALDPKIIVFTFCAALGMLYFSRRVFRFALSRYRSASS